MSPISILLASHQPIMRSGLRALLEQEIGFKVVAEAANGREALVLSEYRQPDVALLDMNLPLLNGIAVARELLARARPTEMVFVTSQIDEAYVHEAFKAGARGYVDADHSATDLIRAVRLVANGRFFLSPTIVSHLLQDYIAKGQITDHETSLWRLVAAGHHEEEIAELLGSNLEVVRTDLRSPASNYCRNALPTALTAQLESVHVRNTIFLEK